MTPSFRPGDDLAAYLARRVWEFRQSAGLSQLALSWRAFGYPWHDRVSGIERGKRGVTAVELWCLARALGRDLAEFFPGE